MNRILVWDLPMRAFHWLLAAAFVGAIGIAVIADDDSPLFQTHMLLGLIAAFLVVLRVIWGVVGTRYARFGSFLFGPKALLGYLRGVFRHAGERYTGHNPGSAYTIYAMLLLSIGLPLSGVLLPRYKTLEELHETMACFMLLTVMVHIVGFVWHTIRGRENIALSMIDGKKVGEESRLLPRHAALLAWCFSPSLPVGRSWYSMNTPPQTRTSLCSVRQFLSVNPSWIGPKKMCTTESTTNRSSGTNFIATLETVIIEVTATAVRATTNETCPGGLTEPLRGDLGI